MSFSALLRLFGRPDSRLRPVTAAALACLVTAGCAGGGAVAPTTAAIPTAAQAGSEYIIGQGDTLRVFVLSRPELSVDVPVRPDGKISTPLANDVQAVGKTPSQLGHDLEKILGEYVRTPTVSVMVSHPTGTFGQVRVVGQAVSPHALPYRSGLTVLDVIIEVGGLSQYAAGNRAKLIRQENGAPREYDLRLNDLINKGDVKQNMVMQPGDILVIPEARF